MNTIETYQARAKALKACTGFHSARASHLGISGGRWEKEAVARVDTAAAAMRLADLALDLIPTDIVGGIPALAKLLHSCKLTVSSTMRKIKKGGGDSTMLSDLEESIAAIGEKVKNFE